MRIFAGGIATETNTFSPIPTTLEDFQVQRGGDVRAGVKYPSLDLSRLWGGQAAACGAELVFGLMAWAEPAGITTRSTYESLRDELLQGLQRSMPIDVALLNLHGAMIAGGYPDCEEDMIGRVRQIVGSQAVIAVEFDLHCHLCRSKIAAADVVITYKEYPHVDVNDRARELFDLALATHLGKIRPTMALFDCRMIGMYPTSRQPLRGFVDAMIEAERRSGVLSLSFAHGFQFADTPDVSAKLLVVTDGNQSLAHEIAQEFGLRAYELRREIGFEAISLPLAEALSRAVAVQRGPVVVADQSDNTGGGAPGDATFALRWLLERYVGNVGMAIFYDPEVVKIAKKAGHGANLPVRLGGKLGPSSGDPVDLEVTVHCLLENYIHTNAQQTGAARAYPLGDVVALRRKGLDIVVASRRCQCFSPAIFKDLRIAAADKHLLVVKSAQHFYNSFASISSEIIYMSGPGAVPPNPKLVAYRQLDTAALYPWAENPLGQKPGL